jgi:hypothetical protein
MLDIQPVPVTLPSEVNTNVKHPPGVDDVNAGGIAVP